ncbi:hypothetical protein P4O66_020713 [Electrophorus voltai]|uniref:FH2 domain-containing protein n=1 Tax=Electrophorus voltai TaxID=2609070 RepID=A0AAD9E196_9TELE|nr:hypothetical protein P4O66_020713 [Electrophorus voltai]
MEDILHGNSAAFGPEALRELYKLLPESVEVEKLHAYGGDPAQLAMVDSFMYHLTLLPSFDLRIEALLLKEEFSPLCSSLKQDICTVRFAARELLSCEELHSVLHLVLEAGNIMNSGGYGGNAVGFKLSSLLSLADTKANKPGMTLLHFVALEAKKTDEQLLKFPEKLRHVESAARVSVEGLSVEWESLSMRIKHVEQKTQSNAELQEQLHMFLQSSFALLEDINKSRTELQKEGDDLIDFFCEDKDTFRLDDCFHIFQHFCSKFTKAVQENIERERREASQMKRMKELEEKRRSWADREIVCGVFGSRCSSETDVQAALKREGLLQLLRSHPQSLQSPFTVGQFGSYRYSWQQPSEGSPNSARSDPDTHSLTLIQTATDSNSELQSSAATHRHTSSGQGDIPVNRYRRTSSGQGDIPVDAHTLVPALQAFNFSPPLDGDHGYSNSQKSSQDAITLMDLEVNNKVGPQSDKWMEENRNPATQPTTVLETPDITSHTVQIGLTAQMGKRSMSLTHSEGENSNDTDLKCNKELKVFLSEGDTSSAFSDQADVKTIRDYSGSNNQASDSTDHALMSKSNESGSHVKMNIVRGEKETQVHRSSSKTKSFRKMTTNPAVSSSKKTPNPPLHPRLPHLLTPTSSSKTSPSPKPTHIHPVRTLTPSEIQSMRRVIPLGQTPRAASTRFPSPAAQSTTCTAPPVQRSSTRTAPPAQRSSTQTAPPPQRSSTHTASSAQRSSTRTASSAQRSSTHTALLAQRSSTHTALLAQRSSTHTALLAQRSSTHTALLAQRSSTHTALPAQTSSIRKSAVQQKSMPEEKMCRSTMRVLAQSGGKSSWPLHQNSAQKHTPNFARNTVASSTRSAVASGNLLVSKSTMATTPIMPSLNGTTSLRLSQSRMNPQIMSGSNSNSGKAGSVCLSPVSGHIRTNQSRLSQKSPLSQVPLKPAWK